MTYALFLIVLATAALVCGALRLIGVNLSFERVFRLLAEGLFWLPVAVMSVAVCTAIVVVVTIAAVALFPRLPDAAIWNSLPAWAWFAVGDAIVLGLLCWREWRPK